MVAIGLCTSRLSLCDHDFSFSFSFGNAVTHMAGHRPAVSSSPGDQSCQRWVGQPHHRRATIHSCWMPPSIPDSSLKPYTESAEVPTAGCLTFEMVGRFHQITKRDRQLALQELHLHEVDCGQLQSRLSMRRSSPSTSSGTRAVEQSMEP
jgi:hypothetical protein